MSSTPNIVHGILAFGSFSAALASLVIWARMGALQFIKDNLIDGLCTDVWDGFFLSPTNLIFIAFLFYLPVHCYTNHAPRAIQFFSALMAIPSYLFVGAVFLETSLVMLPLGLSMGLCTTFGLAQYRQACRTQKPPSPPTKKPSVSFSPLHHNKLRSSSSSIRKTKSVEFNLTNNSDLVPFAPLTQNEYTSVNHNIDNYSHLVSPKSPNFLAVPKPKISPLPKRKRSVS